MATNDAAEDSLDSLELKKRARRRLVGAAALALLAVVVLPMVMDSEPKPVAQDIQVRIPSQENDGLAGKVLSGKPSATPLPAMPEKKLEVAAAVPPPQIGDVAASPVSREAGKVENKAEAKVETKIESKPEIKTDPKADSKTKLDVKADKPTDKAKADKLADKSASDKPAKKTEEARATAALEGKGSNAAGGQWVVQLGAYQNSGNIKLLLAKLKELGVPAYTEKLDSADGVKTRVRAGPFPSKEAAEKAQNRIKIIGVSGPVGQK